MIPFFSSLAPSLTARSQARRANRMALNAESMQDLSRAQRNETALAQAELDAHLKTRHNQQVSKQFFQTRDANKLNETFRQQEARRAELERVIGKEAAAGALLAQQAQRGLVGTGLAAQINDAQAFRMATSDQSAQDSEAAARWNYRQGQASLAGQAFSQFNLSQAMVGLDYSKTKVTRVKSKPFLQALGSDIGRGVAGFFGGSWATQAIDMVSGNSGRQAQAQSVMQGALDQIYGGSVQLKQASGPDFAGLIGGLRGSGGGLSGLLQGGKGGGFNWGLVGTSMKDLPFMQKGQQFMQLYDGYKQAMTPKQQPSLSGGFDMSYLISGGGVGGQARGLSPSGVYGMLQTLSRPFSREG